MNDNDVNKTTSENTCNKIKAIYPHITVSGDKPYYSIDWYDIEQKTMIRGCSSYKLELVRKWLQEDFEVVEADIDNLINRLQAEVEQWKEEANKYQNLWCEAFTDIQTAKSAARKEFAERLKDKLTVFNKRIDGRCLYEIGNEDIDNLLKELDGKENSNG